MTTPPTARRVRLHEWTAVRDLRLEAVADPAAAIAFLTTSAEESARDESFWRQRTAAAALGENAAQFIADAGDRWVGTVTVLMRAPGTRDHLDRDVLAPRADVVGVYVSPSHRGTGVLGALFDEAAVWAAAHGADALTLDVHADNGRAQAAYRKAGFVATGVTFTSSIGPEIEMSRPIRAGEASDAGGR